MELTPDFEKLEVAVTGTSREMLRKEGTILPFAAALTPEGKVAGIVLPWEAGRTRGEVWVTLPAALRKMIVERGFRAVATCTSGHALDTATQEQSKSVLVHFEDGSGRAVAQSTPYVRGVDGEWFFHPPNLLETDPQLYPGADPSDTAV